MRGATRDGGQYAWRCTRVAPAVGSAPTPPSAQQLSARPQGPSSGSDRNLFHGLSLCTLVLPVDHRLPDLTASRCVARREVGVVQTPCDLSPVSRHVSNVPTPRSSTEPHQP